MRFVIEELNGLAEVASLPGHEDATPDVVRAILEEAGRLGREVLSPLNRSGDLEGAKLENGVVRTPRGFKEAYRAYVDGGWNTLQLDREIGGQGLPMLVSTPVFEMWDSANLAFMLCPVLTIAGAEMLQRYGSERQKTTWMPKLVTGEWTGTMVLTEPGAGSDVGALKTRAVPDGDVYRLTGQKIFTTWGDHDFTENIVHMVLARTPDAPPGTRGISLFIVPKFLVNDDGTLGRRNDLRPVSLERKLGIHGSPTCVMQFGENEGAIGYLVGEECRGMEYMFAMMNNAPPRSRPRRRRYRRTGLPAGGGLCAGENSGPRHVEPGDRRRRDRTPSRRAAEPHDHARPDRGRPGAGLPRCGAAGLRPQASGAGNPAPGPAPGPTSSSPSSRRGRRIAASEIASLGVQIHGGAGFIEETGAAQHYRDSRITPIYEGTNGIQAIDLLSRKIMRDGARRSAICWTRCRRPKSPIRRSRASSTRRFRPFGPPRDRLLSTEEFGEALAGATPCLRALGFLAGGWLMARSAEISAGPSQNGPAATRPSIARNRRPRASTPTIFCPRSQLTPGRRLPVPQTSWRWRTRSSDASCSRPAKGA